MKRIRISIVALFAILCGLGLSSFTKPMTPKPYTDSWFIYDGGSMTAPSNYTFSSTVPTCAQTTRLCAIHVLNDGSDEHDQAALTALYNNNNQFKQPVQGVIKFKN
ncbi:MAG: hypothetical protein ABIP68_01550 [Ferruginibacter sp.]